MLSELHYLLLSRTSSLSRDPDAWRAILEHVRRQPFSMVDLPEILLETNAGNVRIAADIMTQVRVLRARAVPCPECGLLYPFRPQSERPFLVCRRCLARNADRRLQRAASAMNRQDELGGDAVSEKNGPTFLDSIPVPTDLPEGWDFSNAAMGIEGKPIRLPGRFLWESPSPGVSSSPIVVEHWTAESPKRCETLLKALHLQEPLEHPTIVPVTEHRRRVWGGASWVELRYAKPRGQRLGDCLSTRKPLDQDLAASVASQVTAAVAHAQSAGVLSAYFGPNELFLDENRRVHIVRLTVPETVFQDSDVLYTTSGPFVGCPLLSPPERWEGRGEIAPSTAFSVGILFLSLILGKPLFHGLDPLTIGTHLERFLENPRKAWKHLVLSTRVASLLERCLTRDVARRPHDLSELARDFDQTRIVSMPTTPVSDSVETGGGDVIAITSTFLGQRGGQRSARARRDSPATENPRGKRSERQPKDPAQGDLQPKRRLPDVRRQQRRLPPGRLAYRLLLGGLWALNLLALAIAAIACWNNAISDDEPAVQVIRKTVRIYRTHQEVLTSWEVVQAAISLCRGGATWVCRPCFTAEVTIDDWLQPSWFWDHLRENYEKDACPLPDPPQGPCQSIPAPNNKNNKLAEWKAWFDRILQALDIPVERAPQESSSWSKPLLSDLRDFRQCLQAIVGSFHDLALHAPADDATALKELDSIRNSLLELDQMGLPPNEIKKFEDLRVHLWIHATLRFAYRIAHQNKWELPQEVRAEVPRVLTRDFSQIIDELDACRASLKQLDGDKTTMIQQATDCHDEKDEIRAAGYHDIVEKTRDRFESDLETLVEHRRTVQQLPQQILQMASEPLIQDSVRKITDFVDQQFNDTLIRANRELSEKADQMKDDSIFVFNYISILLEKCGDDAEAASTGS